MFNIQSILHPTDFSDSANAALKIASSLAKERRAKLILLHVAQRPVTSVGGMPVPPPTPAIDFKGLKAQLDSIAAGMSNVQVYARVVEGEPASAIVEIARELGADIIVVGSHGRTGLSRLLMGSVAENVVRNAACPVLTVKMSRA